MFSIIIPIYNESENIESLIKEIYHSLKKKNYNKYEIILVDDFSEDNTNTILSKLEKIYEIKIIKNFSNQGQSFSIHKGILEASHNTIVTLDGDGQNNPKDMPSLIDKYFSDEKIYLVGGIRHKRKDSLIKVFSSKVANFVRSSIFDDDCKDTGCSLKIFDRDVFLNFPFFNGIHRFLPSLFKGYGYDTFFINVDHRPRTKGKSKYGTFDRLYRGIFDIIKVKKIIKRNLKKHEYN